MMSVWVWRRSVYLHLRKQKKLFITILGWPRTERFVYI